jgi:hypothetical protein
MPPVIFVDAAVLLVVIPGVDGVGGVGGGVDAPFAPFVGTFGRSRSYASAGITVPGGVNSAMARSHRRWVKM